MIVDALTTLLVPSHKGFATTRRPAPMPGNAPCARTWRATTSPSGTRLPEVSRQRASVRTGAHTQPILGVFTNHGYDETVSNSPGVPAAREHRTALPILRHRDQGTVDSDRLRRFRLRPARAPQDLRSAGADVFDEFPKYATSLRRLLGIRSEQALRTLPPDRLYEVRR